MSEQKSTMQDKIGFKKKTTGMTKKIIIFLGFKGIMSISILIMVVVFCLQNNETTSIQLLFWNVLEISKLYLIAISTFLGIALGVILGCRFSKV